MKESNWRESDTQKKKKANEKECWVEEGGYEDLLQRLPNMITTPNLHFTQTLLSKNSWESHIVYSS